MQKKTFTALTFAALLAGCSGGVNNNQAAQNADFERIKADQIGYQTNTAKIAVIPETGSEDFEIVDFVSQKTVYKGKASEIKEWEFSKTKVRQADFSDFNQDGIYFLKCKGAGDSYPFAIGEGIYDDLAIKAMKSYYFARCSQEIKPEYGGKYARPAAHPDDKIKVHKSAAGPKRKEGDIISSPGGWYDAGDYNKYIVNSSISVWEILNTIELYPDYCKKLNLNIPESKNALPDILDEVLVNLRWMLTMQDPNDGGVYHKLTALGFNGMIMPHDDKDERYVIKKSTTAALDFAAVCAKAARVVTKYANELPGLSDTLKKAAVSAWNWAQKNPEILYDKNPEGVFTGQYNDTQIRDEFTWAALEMTLLTDDKNYLKNISEKDFAFQVPSWDSTSCLGIASVLNNPKNAEKFDESFYNFFKDGFIKLSDRVLKNYETSAYATPLTVFPWGSNSVAANQGLILVTAYNITGNTKYLEAAEADLHYILGRNPLDYCFVTGFGGKSVKYIHDRRTVADGIDAPVAGYLCGGPYAHAGGDVPDSLYTSTAPAMRYLDNHNSYTTNEIAINWNSALVFLVYALH